MKLLLDMNLSPRWIQTLEEKGWETVHWTSVGDPRASDREIMKWAHDHDHVVVTHDLDFGAMLAATSAQKPSVIQVRTRDVTRFTSSRTNSNKARSWLLNQRRREFEFCPSSDPPPTILNPSWDKRGRRVGDSRCCNFTTRW